MNISKIIILLTIILGTASCTQERLVKITTSPISDIKEGEYRHILRNGNFFEGEYNKAIDSLRYINGRLEYSGPVRDSLIAFISFKNSAVDFVLEEGNIFIDIEKQIATGTPLNNDLALYTQRTSGLRDRDSIKNITLEHLNKNKGNVLEDYYLHRLINFGLVYDNEFETIYADRTPGPIYYRPFIGAKNKWQARQEVAVGKPYKDFTIEHGNLDGTTASLSDYVGKGKYVLLDFWASWCGWCRVEFPAIADVYKKYKKHNLEVVGIVVEDKLENTKKALKEEQLCTWPQIVNCGRIPTLLYGIHGIPQIMLISPDGIILEKNLRGDKIEEAIKKHILKNEK